MMKAITLNQYGTPEVLRLADVIVPEPAANEVLVRVKAASLNALDKHLSSGMMLARPKTGLLRPKYGILGSDLAGEVVKVGEGVSEYKSGDRVFGARLWGAFAEFACLPVEKMAKIPEGLSFQEAAALPVAGITALQGLVYGGIMSGHEVLINGASGGVGTFSVQLAKYFGAKVTAVCGGTNVSLVYALGANEVVNYQTDDIRNVGKQFDLVLDNVGNLSIVDSKRLTLPGGSAIVVGFSSAATLLSFMFRGPLVSRLSGKKIAILDTKVNPSDLNFLAHLVAQGEIRSLIDQEYGLADVRKAMEYLWTRRVKSKLVLNV